MSATSTGVRVALIVVLSGAVLAIAMSVALPSASAKSRDCGTVNVPNSKRDARVLAHKVRCKKARRVAKYAVGNGPRPKGWTCSASLGRCYRGGFNSRHYVKVKWE